MFGFSNKLVRHVTFDEGSADSGFFQSYLFNVDWHLSEKSLL